MAQQMTVKVTTHKNKTDNTEYYEALVTLVGLNLRPTKLTRADGATAFVSKTAANTTARNLAKKLGWEIGEEEQPVRKAAKRAPKKVETPPANWVESQETQN